MPDPEIASLTREARRRRRLPPKAACAACGVASHLSPGADGRVLCYGCVRAESGACGVELDHAAGWRNLGGLLVQLRGNDHRTVTENRLRLGIDQWPDAEGDPLLTAAHTLAAVASILLLLAEWLVALAADAAGRLGAVGWDGAPPFPVVP